MRRPFTFLRNHTNLISEKDLRQGTTLNFKHSMSLRVGHDRSPWQYAAEDPDHGSVPAEHQQIQGKTHEKGMNGPAGNKEQAPAWFQIPAALKAEKPGAKMIRHFQRLRQGIGCPGVEQFERF